MNDDKLKGRRVFSWKGKNPVADVNAFADAIAEVADLFNLEGTLVWLNDGELIPVTKILLVKIITKFIARKRIKNIGTKWAVEYCSFEFPISADIAVEPNDAVLNILLGTRQRVDQPEIPGLLERVPRVTAVQYEMPPLSERERREIRMRIAQGEDANTIAAYYRIPAEAVRQLGR